MDKFSHLGLNNRFQKLGGLQDRATYIKGIDFDIQYEMQGRGMKTGKPSIGQLVMVSGTADAVGTINDANRGVFTSDISPAVGFAGNIVAGWCSQEIYEGLSVNGSQMIFPSEGGSIAVDRWRGRGGYRQLGGSEINHRFEVVMHNNSGGALPVYAVAKWKFIINGGGTTSA